MVPNEKRMGDTVDGGRKLSYRTRREWRWERKMGITLDPTSVVRPSTPPVIPKGQYGGPLSYPLSANKKPNYYIHTNST